jgi:hypothetical protein
MVAQEEVALVVSEHQTGATATRRQRHQRRGFEAVNLTMITEAAAEALVRWGQVL